MSLVKGISISFIFTLIGKVLGFARFVLIGQLFGVSVEVDAFFILFSVIMVWEAIILTGFVGPSFIRKFNSSHSQRHSLFFYTFYFSLVLSVAVFIVVSVLSKSLFFVGLSEGLIANLKQLAPIFSAAVILSVFTQIPTFVSQANERYAVSTMNPIIWNTTQCLYLVMAAFYYVELSMLMYVYSLLVGYLLSSLYQIAKLTKIQRRYFLPSKELRRKSFAIGTVSLLALPLFDEGSSLTLLYFYTLEGEGWPSLLGYSSRVIKLVGGLVSASIGIVVFNRLTKDFNDFNRVVVPLLDVLFPIGVLVILIIQVFSVVISFVMLGEVREEFTLLVTLFSFYIPIYICLFILFRAAIAKNETGKQLLTAVGLLALYFLSAYALSVGSVYIYLVMYLVVYLLFFVSLLLSLGCFGVFIKGIKKGGLFYFGAVIVFIINTILGVGLLQFLIGLFLVVVLIFISFVIWKDDLKLLGRY